MAKMVSDFTKRVEPTNSVVEIPILELDKLLDAVKKIQSTTENLFDGTFEDEVEMSVFEILRHLQGAKTEIENIIEVRRVRR
jgi:hypothetical protein